MHGSAARATSKPSRLPCLPLALAGPGGGVRDVAVPSKPPHLQRNPQSAADLLLDGWAALFTDGRRPPRRRLQAALSKFAEEPGRADGCSLLSARDDHGAGRMGRHTMGRPVEVPRRARPEHRDAQRAAARAQLAKLRSPLQRRVRHGECADRGGAGGRRRDERRPHALGRGRPRRTARAPAGRLRRARPRCRRCDAARRGNQLDGRRVGASLALQRARRLQRGVRRRQGGGRLPDQQRCGRVGHGRADRGRPSDR